ncbi:protein split ends isoform X3 [Culicoides brevitarsis]|uniref:protein split ends isoform X3 n=1 Tax=Culicoides brevitarsis TaxID=469753 RepID=UPI00307C0ACD
MVRETRHLWVGNLPETVREDRIREHFKRSDDHSSSHGFDRNFYSHTKSRDARSSLLSSSCQLEPCIDNANCVHHTSAGSGSHPSALHRRASIHGSYHGAAASSPSSASDVVVVRGRARDRHYTSNRNGAYSTCVDRSTPIGHHRISSNNWYESSSSSSSRNLYGSTIKSDPAYESPHLERSNSTRSDLLDASNNSKSRHHSSSSSSVASHNHARHASSTLNNNASNVPSNSVNSSSSSSHHNNTSSRHVTSGSSAKKKKSRSGSGTPCSTSSRSRSHSRSSCSSSNSDSSNESGGSPVPGSRNLQSAIGAAPICTNSSSSSLAGSSAGSSSSHHHLGDDTRSLAIRVRNLPVRSSDTSIKDGLFHEYKKNGKVTWVKVVGTNIDRYAIVCFKKAEDAEKALEDSKDKLFFGCRIDVELYQGFDLQDSDFRAYEAELDEYHPKATRTLFIGNLEKDISASELRKYFDSFGEIIDIDIKKQGLTAYAFCQYANIVSVVKAMRKMDGEHLGNNRIKLGFGKSMHTNCVWIDGVADTVSENYLISQFSRFGPVEGVVIDRERKLALITFEQNQNAQLAVKEMRGTTLRSRKIQIDFASRECQTAFYEKLSNNKNKGVSERACSFETTVTVPGSRSYNNSSRYENASSTSSTSSSRGRAASFSRPNNPLSGAASPSSQTSVKPRQIRYTSTTTDYYSTTNDANDVLSLAHDRRIRSYDEFSQGSGASHEDLYEATSTSGGSIRGGSLSRDHVESPQSRLGSVISSVGDNSSNLHINNSCNSRVANNIDETTQHGVTGSTNAPSATNSVVRRRGSETQGDIKPLLRERSHLLEQLEECPSSGDELVSPKKRRYGSNYVIDHSTTTTNSTNNHHHHENNVVGGGEHNNMPNNHHHHHHMAHPHRKGVEIRRLSEASLKQHTAASQLHSSSSTNNSNCNNNNNNNSRRPSTDSLSRSSSIIDHTFSGSLTKRRKTSAALPNDDHHSSSGRGHRLHSMHSHEASGGESADGSRPGTPLCDEPSEPRRIPRERSHEPMVLPLPKFAEQFFIKLRALQKEQQKDTFLPAALQSQTSFPSSSGATGQVSNQQTPPTVPLALQSSTNIPAAVSNSSLNATSTTLTSPTNTIFSPSLRTATTNVPITLNSSSSTTTTSTVASTTEAKTTTTEPTSPNNTATTRPPSLPSSNSSDSETEVRNPLLEESSLEERLRALDDKYEKWSGGSSHRRSHGENNGNSAGYRHKLLELDVKEVQPSDIAKTLLAKKSIFDDDSRRLENIGDKYEPREFSNYARTIPAVPLVTATSAIPIQTKPATPPIVTPPAEKAAIPTPPLPAVVNLSQIHQQRLVGSNSPMRSPPYTSPSSASSGNGATTPVIKQLQYPFPSHPPTAGSTSTTNTATTTTVSSADGTKTSASTALQKSNSLPDASNASKTTMGNSTNATSNRVLTKSTSLPAGTTQNETQNVETTKNDEKSYKDRRKTSLQEEMQVDTESDQEQKQLKQQQEAEARRAEAAEREKRENEQRRQQEKREAERREEKLRKEREEAERRAKEERARQTEQQQKPEEKPKSDRSHNHKHNNSASTSPVRGGNNKRRLSSPDAPLTNHVETTEVTKKSKPDSGKSVEKTPSKYHHKKEDRASPPDEKSRHGDKDLFDCLRSEHKSEKHHKLNRKHSSTTTSHAGHAVKEEQPSVKQEMHRDKENSQTDNTMDNKAFFDAIELRSSEEEQRLRAIRRENKERKDSQDKSTTSGNSCDDGISSKHESRKNSRSDHVSSDDMSGSKKSRSKTSRRPKSSHSHRHQQSQSHTSDETDSDGRKKHSIFDIPDEGPYVSMYDKVKARSCKNMQKQEEKKKTKAKFGKFKRVREAKREGKKRSTSWDEDSDSDDEENVRYRRVSKGLASSSDDDMSHHNRMSDSEGEKMHFNRQKLHELCEGESSDAQMQAKRSPRRKISSRKNSRTTRLALDSSDEEDIKTPIKTELKTELISEDEECLKINTATIKQEIKEENYQKGLQTPVSAPAMMDNKTSAFDQLFGHESKKKHKKNKKRQKSFPMDSTDEDALPLSERRDTEGEMPKSELDKSLEAAHDRRSSKHGSKKEKKREKTREEHERKKARKANKLMGKQQSLDIKREEKMEDIFGPLSDEESRQSPTNSVVSPSTSAKSSGNNAFDQIRKPQPSQQPQDESHESRKQRKEKKRREKHNKNTSQHGKEDENSVDLDEAGRALEAQLMSDSEKPATDAHKSNHEEATDVFRFSDGEDSLDSSKKDTSEHRREKKKKKKKSKEEKHKHHHHKNHNDEKLLSPEPMSLPSLVDDHVESHSQASSKPKTNTIRGNGMTSPPPKSMVTSSPVKGEDHKPRKEVLIPGFGGIIDEKIHESAVLSIVETPAVTNEPPKVVKTEAERAESPSKAMGEAKNQAEEKSRVIISQEETEDAVAALLGESFGTSNVTDYNEIFEEPVEEAPVAPEEPVIPAEDDEEMKKAIQSLNTDEMDIKADTPQSENDLQIDTDTEETEEPEKTSQFDNPPKTPDVDFAQIRKNAEKEQENKKIVSPLVAKPEVAKMEEAPKKIPVSIPQVKFTAATSITTNANKSFSVLQPPTIKIPAEVQETPKAPQLLSPRSISIPTTSASKQASPRRVQQDQKARQMMSPTKETQQQQIIFHAGTQAGQQLNAPGNAIGQVPLNRFPIITQSGSKPIQPTNVLLSQPSQATLSAVPNKQQVHLPAGQQQPPQQKENQTIFIHQQQTPRGSIQVVHHQVNIPPFFAPNQPNAIPIQRGAHPSNIPPKPEIFVQQAPSTSVGEKNLERPASSVAASTLFDKLKATTDVNPQRLSPHKDDKRPEDAQETKEDTEYWSARDVNIDSVIQKLCSEEETGSDSSKTDENSKKSESNVEKVVQPKPEEVESKPEDVKVKGKGGRKRKNTENNEAPKTTIEKIPEAPMQVPVIPPVSVANADEIGVQTRNTRTTNAKPTQAKRGNGRGGRGGKQGVQGNKPRNQNSESDVYEFHDDSSDNDNHAKAIDAAAGNVAVPSVTVTPITVPQTSAPILPPQIAPSTQTVITQPMPLNLETTEKSPQQQPTSPNTDGKEDFLSPGQAAANTRKSRRLLERDGSRSTVDDIIEDVVRNSTTQSPKNSPLRQPSSPAGSGTTLVSTPVSIPNVVVTQASVAQTPAGRRNTRQNNLPEKQNLADVRKSPRAGQPGGKKANKDRKLSENSVDSSSDEAKVKLEGIKVEIKTETPPMTFTEMTHEIKVEEKLVIPKQEDVVKTQNPVVEAPVRMQYKPIPIEKPPTSNASPKPLTITSQPVIVNLPPGSNPPNSVQNKPPNTTIHLPLPQHSQAEIKVVPLPNPPTSQATAVIQHTPISIQQPPNMTQKLPVTVSQTTFTAGQKPSTHPMPLQMQQQPIKHVIDAKQAPSQTVVKICGPPNVPHSQQQSQSQAQQLPPGAIMTKHGPIQPQIHGPTGNLVINIPPGSVSVTQQQSPRMQTSHMIAKQQQQGMPPHPQGVQILQQTKQPSQSPGPQMIQVNSQQQQAQNQQQLQPQLMIHGKPVQIQGPGGYTTVFQGTKIIHQGPQNAPSPSQQGPAPGKQYQVQQIQLTPGQPLPQGTIVTQQSIKMSKSGELQLPQTQQIHIPGKAAHQKPSQVQQQQVQQAPSLSHHLVKQGSITIQQAQTPPMHPNAKQQMAAPQIQPPQQQQNAPQMKGNMIGLHQAPQILTGAVASPPLKHSHVQSQQPIVAGASSSRVPPPTMSPQGRAHALQAGLPVSAFEHASLHREKGVYSSVSAHSPPPAHQQATPITPGDGNFPPGQIRAIPREYYHPNYMYQQHVQRQQEALAVRLPPHLPRSPMLPGTAEPVMSEVDESMVASPPLELRRPASGPRITSVPLSLQSPGDRATDSPYIHGARVPHYPHDPNHARFYEGRLEPPPAHRANAPGSSQYVGSTPPPTPASLLHIQREREEREQRERAAAVAAAAAGHPNMPPHAGLVPAMPEISTRGMQIATPPHGSQVPHSAESLDSLLKQYPVMWQGLLALKNDQAAVQMHFVYGSRDVAAKSLPRNIDGSNPPLRIAQRMRLEPVQIDGVARKMQVENEHCMLLALPCGRDQFDVLTQLTNLQSGFITYLQQKQAAGIVNIAEPGSQQASYVVHIFPSCEFANESLTRIAPDLLHRVQNIAHLLIVIATV